MTSSEFPLLEGCLAEIDVFEGGEVEFLSDTGIIIAVALEDDPDTVGGVSSVILFGLRAPTYFTCFRACFHIITSRIFSRFECLSNASMPPLNFRFMGPL